MGSDTRPRADALNAFALRTATTVDLPAIAALERECYSDPWPMTAFTSLPDNPRVFFSVAEAPESKRLLGYAVGWYIMDEGELANLAVAHTERRRGVARALLDAMLGDADRRGIRDVYLEVRESNLAARKLYASRDFVEVGRRKRYYRSPEEDALILRRTLKPLTSRR